MRTFAQLSVESKMIANKRRTFHFSYPTIALKTLFRRLPFLRIHILSVFDERPNVHSLVSAHKSDVWMLRHAPHTNTLALGATKFRTIVVLVKKMCQSIFHRKLAATEAVYSTDRRAGQIAYSWDVAGCTKNLFRMMKINGYWCLADETWGLGVVWRLEISMAPNDGETTHEIACWFLRRQMKMCVPIGDVGRVYH